jgi:hypothetical protein
LSVLVAFVGTGENGDFSNPGRKPGVSRIV